MGISERTSGSVHICKCPHHEDEHQSLTIYRDTNSYYCFQCGDADDVFRFVMGQKRCNFHDALAWIEKLFPEVLAYRPKGAKDNRRKIKKSEEERKKQKILMENTYYHGLAPGIYQQSSEYDSRGALGSKEQALLICDVLPNERSNPGSESSVSSLSVVAHIPVLEAKNQQNKEQARKELNELLEHCNNDFWSTILDNDAETPEKILKKLGKIFDSDWLVQRGEYYKEYHKIKPQSWPPPALIDWLYVEMKEQDEFYKNEGLMAKNKIQVPE